MLHAPEFSLITVRWLAWATLALVLMLVLGLLLLRWLRWRSEPQKLAFRQQWSALLMRCAMGEDLGEPLPALKPSEQWPFMKLWLHCQMSLKGPSRDRLAALAYALGCQSVAMRKLASPYAAERLMATLALGFLKDEQAQPALLEQLRGDGQQTALHAARALLEIDANAHTMTVVQSLLTRANLDLSLVSVLLKPFRGTLSNAMTTLMPLATPMPVPDSRIPTTALQWLRLGRALSLQVSGEHLASFLTHSEDIDLLIAAIRLMQGEQGTQALASHARHADWRVRAQVAQALGRIGQLPDVDLLVHMTTDSQWWVRYRATQALLSMPSLPHSQAQSLIQGTCDRFAVNMFESVIAEREAIA